MKIDNTEAQNQNSSGNVEQEQLHTNKHRNQKRKRIVVTILMMVLLFLFIGFAWYYYNAHRKVESEDRMVMSPYYLYLVDAGGQDYLDLTVGNLHPGETKQVVIGVTNNDPKGTDNGYTIGKEAEFDYQLQLAYTKNLPVDYKVYELTKLDEDDGADDTIVVQNVDEEGDLAPVGYWKKRAHGDSVYGPLTKDTSLTERNNTEMYGESIPNSVKNLGQYDLYERDADGTTKMQLNTDNSGPKVEFDLDYYLIEINWKNDVNFSEYTKETDLVYVIARALQLKPVEK